MSAAPPVEPHPVPEHIPAHLRDAYARAKGRQYDWHPKCPYKPGDPVKRHGYGGNPGHPTDHARTGFRGWVVATVGATILTGITTDGAEWWEEWGLLEPADTPVQPWGHCSCCREERLKIRRALAKAEQAKAEAERRRAEVERLKPQQLGLFTTA